MNVQRWFGVVLIALTLIGSIQGAAICVTCMLKCFDTAAICLAAGPAGSTACFLLCEGIGAMVCLSPACFNEDTMFHVLSRDGERVVEKMAPEVVVGDLVQTIHSNGDQRYTEVVGNTKITGPSDFVKLTTNDGKNLTVTASHLLALYQHNNSFNLVPASNLHEGDIILDSQGNHAMVYTIEQQVHQVRYNIVTRHGTVLANHLWVPTLCDDHQFTVSGDFHQQLSEWRSLHEPLYAAKLAAYNPISP